MPEAYTGALVCWANGGDPAWGVISASAPTVRALMFISMVARITRLLGQARRSSMSSSTSASPSAYRDQRARRGRFARRKPQERSSTPSRLPPADKSTVTEDGVRIAVETDPIARLRAGQLDTRPVANLRLAATRLLFAHQYDELSSLSNSRVEIKPHQVGVAPPRRDDVPAPLHPRRRGRARKDDRGRPDHQGAQGARRRQARPDPRAVGDRLPVAVRAEDEVQRGLRALQPSDRSPASRPSTLARTSGRSTTT